MAAKLLNLLPSHGARERRERWQFDIRFTQCDGLSGLGDLSSNLGSVEGEVCVQLARHAKVAVSQCAAVAGGRSGGGGDGGGDEGGEGMMQTSSFAFMHITPESEISSWQQRSPQPRP